MAEHTLEIDLVDEDGTRVRSILLDGEYISGQVVRLGLDAEARGAYVALDVLGEGDARVSVRIEAGAVRVVGRLDDPAVRLLRALVKPAAAASEEEQGSV